MSRLIDADALLKDKVFLCGGFESDYCQGYMDALNAVEKAIKEVTAVDAVPVVNGKWVGVEFDMFFECSECGCLTDYHLTNFCPNCGAKMKIKEKEHG